MSVIETLMTRLHNREKILERTRFMVGYFQICSVWLGMPCEVMISEYSLFQKMPDT